MKRSFRLIKKMSSVIATISIALAVSSTASACHYWFAEPKEPEELRAFVAKRKRI